MYVHMYLFPKSSAREQFLYGTLNRVDATLLIEILKLPTYVPRYLHT